MSVAAATVPTMDLQLYGRRAVVTGSTSGIGEAIARGLAHEGCAVLVHGRDEGRAAEVARELGAAGTEAGYVTGDLTDPGQASRVTTRAREWQPDIAVTNAGPLEEHDWDTVAPEDWLAAINGNLVSAARVTQAVVPGMRARGWGRIVNIGSRAAVTPQPQLVDYSAAKAAVLSATASLAAHLAGSGITVNAVSPGVIVTPRLQRMFEERATAEGRASAWSEIEQRVTAEYAPNPSGRLGTGEDVAAAVAYLASPLAGYVNGTNLRVDGGISAT